METKYIIRAIESKKVDYFCKKHKRIHKHGTKIWERDLKEIDEARVSDKIKMEAKKLQKKLEEESKEWYLKQDKVRQDIMNIAIEEAEIRLNKGQYFVYELMYFYEGRKPELRMTGNTQGYTSLSKAMEDRYVASDIEKAKKSSESTILITKATLVKVIGK